MINYYCALIKIPYVRIFLAFSIVISLLLLPNAPFMIYGKAWGLQQERSGPARRTGQPKPGKPEATLPNLDAMRTARPVEREMQAPILRRFALVRMLSARGMASGLVRLVQIRTREVMKRKPESRSQNGGTLAGVRWSHHRF